MTFFEAEAITTASFMPVRRTGRPDNEWFAYWRALWFFWDVDKWRVVWATDYGPADLLANDWTTVPAPLTSCPITPTEPLGGGPPGPGFPGFPTPGTPTGFPPAPGGGGGGGTPPGSYPPLPTPAAGTGLTVDFEGVTVASSPNLSGLGAGSLDGSRDLEASGAGVWTGSFPAGKYIVIGGDGIPTGDSYDFVWNIRVTKSEVEDDPNPLFDPVLTCTCPDNPGVALGAAFGSYPGPGHKGDQIHNTYGAGVGNPVYGGTATVG